MPKLSQYDTQILPPSLAVGGDGTLHVAFVEEQATSPFNYFVYYRSSKDGGTTWSPPTNLSEAMPGFNVGTCRLVLDGKDRPGREGKPWDERARQARHRGGAINLDDRDAARAVGVVVEAFEICAGRGFPGLEDVRQASDPILARVDVFPGDCE